MRIIAIVQARMTSSRFPGKVMVDLLGKPVLKRVIERLKLSSKLDDIVVSTSTYQTDDIIEDFCNREHINFFRGSETDVLSRFYFTAKKFKADSIVRITADCPLLDPKIMDDIIEKFVSTECDYISNSIKRSFPDGLDVEVMKFSALEHAKKLAVSNFDKEHVTPYIRKNNLFFKIEQHVYEKDFSDYRWTLDTKQDLEIISSILSAMNEDFSWLDALEYVNKYPHLKGVLPSDRITEKLRLRRYKKEDIGLLFEWVNNPSSLNNKLNTKSQISFEEHKKWFDATLKNERIIIWILEIDSQPVGQVRVFDKIGKLMVDIYLEINFRRKGISKKAIELIIEHVKIIFPGEPIFASVKSNNLSSLKLFESCNFERLESSKNDVIEFKYNIND